MRLILFEENGKRMAIRMEIVRHVLSDIRVWPLPCLREAFEGVFLYEDQVVPQLRAADTDVSTGDGALLLVCDSSFGPVGIAADRILRITAAGEYQGAAASAQNDDEVNIEIDGLDYSLYHLDKILEAAAA